MTSAFLLLSLPNTSEGFNTVRSTALEASLDDGLAPPPRKVARLSAESDSASASRSKAKGAAMAARKPAGTLMAIEIVGEYKSQPPAADQQLKLLIRCIRCILTRDPGPADILPATYEAIYTACQAIVTVSHQGEDLYNNVKMELEKSITQLSRSLALSTEKDTSWIATFNKALAWLEQQIVILKSLLTYLDQFYVVQERNVMNVHDLAYFLVGEHIFGSARIAENLRTGVKNWLEWERTTGKVHSDRAVISTSVDHLLRHHQYSAFEEYYINITQAFYLDESSRQAEALKDDPNAFFNSARGRIQEEAARSKVILPLPTWGTVREVTEQSLWSGRTEWLADATLAGNMDNQDYNGLETMYTLFARIGATKALDVAFGNHIRITVSNIVKDPSRDDEMVQRLLDFKELADTVVSSSFLSEKINVTSTTSTQFASSAPVASTSQLPSMQPDQEFLYTLTDAFSTGFKSRRWKPAEMIAKFLDKAMRKGQGKATNSEFQAVLDKVLQLYRFTDDKDVFRTFYHRSLAKRLLLEKSASDDFEKEILKKLKEDYDPEFGTCEDMFKDLALSRESMREYHSRLDEDSHGQRLYAMVLQRSAWPFTVQKYSIDLPPSMQAELTKYGDYYKSKHSGHVLAWDHSLGTATLKASFNPGIKELSVSLHQAVVLLLFNESTEIPFADVKEQTNMDDVELRRTLQSLACGKKKILKKIPPGKDVNDTDIFRFNADFDDPRAKVHINSIQAKVSPEESQRTNASIDDDRKHYLDAAIVRVMKARRELTYEQLKAATIDAVKGHFVPQVDVIKKRIDSLVETEYLERSSRDMNKYLYVA